MKRWYIVLSIFCTASWMYASNQELFLRGNKAYAQGAYEKALDYYEQIAQKGASVWHNMGNCCHYLDRPVDACVYWKRAQKHANAHDYCVLDTQIAALDTHVYQESSTMQAQLSWVRSHTASYSLVMIQILTLLTWLAFFIAMRRANVNWFIRIILGIFTIALIWLSIDMQKQRCQIFSVTKEEVPVYVGPNASYHQQGSIHQARTVMVTEERDGWSKITHKELAGWVQADKLVKV